MHAAHGLFVKTEAGHPLFVGLLDLGSRVRDPRALLDACGADGFLGGIQPASEVQSSPLHWRRGSSLSSPAVVRDDSWTACSSKRPAPRTSVAPAGTLSQAGSMRASSSVGSSLPVDIRCSGSA